MQTLSILQKLITFDTQSKKTNRAIVQYIASYFPKKLVRITKVGTSPDWYNLAVRFPGKDSKHPLIFSGHTDTVPVSNAWTKNPFKPVIQDGKVFGLGATDMKAGVAAMIVAAQSIKDTPNRDIWFLFDAAEESSGAGGKEFVKTLKIKPGSAQVIVGEPTGGQVIIGQKGAIEFFITTRGKAFHSSFTSVKKNLRFNAVQKAARVINRLAEMEKLLETKSDPLFGCACQSVNKITGGTAGNVIADQCQFMLNRRVVPGENLDEIIQMIRSNVRAVDRTATVEIGFVGDASLVSDNSPVLLMAKKISRQVWGKSSTGVFTGWTQAGLFKKWGDCIIWGPGAFAMAHQADEYCPITDLDKMAKCYSELIRLM